MNSGKYPQSEIEIDTYLKDGDDFYRFDYFAGKSKTLIISMELLSSPLTA